MTLGDTNTDAELNSVRADQIPNVHDHIITSVSQAKDVFNNQLSDGESVWFGPGEYVIDSRLETNADNVTVDGAGRRAVTIKVADGANVGALAIGVGASGTLTSVTVKHIGIDGNRPNQTSGDRHHGITFENCDDIEVESVYIERTHPQVHNNGGSGITARDSCTKLKVTDTVIDDIGDRGIQSAADITIVSDYIYTNGFDRGVSGDVIQPDGNTYYSNYVHVSDSVADGISNGSFANAFKTGLTVKGCTVKDPLRAISKGHAKYTKIVDNTGINAQITEAKGKWVTVKNNTTENAPKVAIDILADRATVEGNKVNGSKAEGLRMVDALDGTVRDNELINTDTDSNGVPCADLQGSKNTVVEHNVFDGGKYGIHVEATGDNSGHPMTFRDNELTGYSDSAWNFDISTQEKAEPWKITFEDNEPGYYSINSARTHGINAYFGMHEGSGSSIADRSQFANDGSSWSGGWTSDGYIGNALDTRTSGGRATVTHDSSIDLSGDGTVWAIASVTTTNNSFNRVLEKLDSNNGFKLEVNDNDLTFYIRNSGSETNVGGISGATLSDFIFLLTTIDSSDNFLTYWGNLSAGDLLTRGGYGSISGGFGSTTNDLYIGSDTNDNNPMEDVILDSVVILDRHTPEGEVRELYQHLLDGSDVLPEALA